MQNTCCRHCTNPHKLPCLRACYPNTNAADMGQCWATGSQQFPGGLLRDDTGKKHASSANQHHPSGKSRYSLDMTMTRVMLAQISIRFRQIF